MVHHHPCQCQLCLNQKCRRRDFRRPRNARIRNTSQRDLCHYKACVSLDYSNLKSLNEVITGVRITGTQWVHSRLALKNCSLTTSTCTSCIGLWPCEPMVRCFHSHLPPYQKGGSVLGSALRPDESPTYIETWHAMQEVLKTGGFNITWSVFW